MQCTTLVQGWHDFYIVAGTAAATLVGLLFVGLSLHLRAVLSRPEVRSLARITLANFALTLFVFLFMVTPKSASATGPFLVGAGVFSLAVIAPSLVAARRSRTHMLRRYQLVMRFGLSALAYVGVIAAGALLGRGSENAALNLLDVTILVLLVVALRNSWDLLVSVGAATLGNEPLDAPPGSRGPSQ